MINIIRSIYFKNSNFIQYLDSILNLEYKIDLSSQSSLNNLKLTSLRLLYEREQKYCHLCGFGHICVTSPLFWAFEDSASNVSFPVL